MWVADRQVTETEKQQKSIPLHTKKKGNNETNSTNMATTTACRQLTAANTSERNQTGESSLISSANGSDDMWDDFCYVCDDACNEITGLMGCCATCPRVFHAKCHVPKYNVKMEDLPDHWRCVICLPYEPLTDQSDEFGEREKLLCAKVYMVCFEESDQAERFLKETVDYHAVIKQPIWFDAIADKISNGVYENVSQFVDDMNLLFQNIATLYPFASASMSHNHPMPYSQLPFFVRSARNRGGKRRQIPSTSVVQYNYADPHEDGQKNRSIFAATKRAGSSRMTENMRSKWTRMVADEPTEIDSGGSPDIGIEVEVVVDDTPDDEEQAQQQQRQQIEHKSRQQIVVISGKALKNSPEYAPPQPSQIPSSSSAGRRHPSHRVPRPSQYTAQQLIKFDPMQCFDIDEFRNRMIAAQRRIEDSASLHLNNNKLKNENAQLREELSFHDHRIAVLESTVMERNERLRELLKENVFMRAQFKKVQNEFGVDAVKEVFNRGGQQRPPLPITTQQP